VNLVECFYVSLGLMALILVVGGVCHVVSRFLRWLGGDANDKPASG